MMKTIRMPEVLVAIAGAWFTLSGVWGVYAMLYLENTPIHRLETGDGPTLQVVVALTIIFGLVLAGTAYRLHTDRLVAKAR